MDQLPVDDPHRRPADASNETVAAMGKLTEALETVERARGALYEFHQLIGKADLKLDEAVDLLRQAGHHNQAQMVQRDLVGRNVLDGRWTFQIIEEFESEYYDIFRTAERSVRDHVLDGRRHVYESEMKERRRTENHAHHTSRPEV